MAGVQIPIEVIDKFSKQLDLLDSKMGMLTGAAQKQQKAFNLLSADVVVRYGREAAGAVFEFAKSSIKSFAESEKSIARLDQAMKNQGITSRQYANDLHAQAAALQRVSQYSDETITETQTLLTTFGLAGKDLKNTTKSALDLASGLGIDLRSATLLLGKAWAGETGSLSRYGIKIDETKTGAEKFAAVMAQVNSRFGGAASSEADTYAGKLAILNNRFDDLKEKIGEQLVSVAGFWVDVMNRGMDAIERMGAASEKLTKSEDKVLVSIRQHIQGIKDEMADTETSVSRYQQLAIQLDRAAFGYAALAKAKGISAKAQEDEPRSSKGGADDRVAELKLQKERMDLQKSAQAKLDSVRFTQDQLNTIQDEADARMIEKNLGKEQAEEFSRAKSLAREKAFNQNKLQMTASTLSTISTLANSHNKALAIIGKTAAIADIMVSTAVGIMRAWKLGPILGPILAPLVGVAGAAQIAVVSGVQLAEGGIVKARSGGLQATIGEGGRDEAVIPLDDPRTRSRLAGALGGGGVRVDVGGITVNVNGDPSQRGIARQLAEEVRAQTVDSIQLALRLSNIANLNSGMAA